MSPEPNKEVKLCKACNFGYGIGRKCSYVEWQLGGVIKVAKTCF